ncbi:hypothetical protein ACE40W_22805 [Enterococcus avium]|uniref:hypothetical protein n=1 Tax=Enterococcus avium TaxID=33945 RepID=UPI0035CC0E68
MPCPICGGNLEEYIPNEYGFHCDTCNYPYPEDAEISEENSNKSIDSPRKLLM